MRRWRAETDHCRYERKQTGNAQSLMVKKPVRWTIYDDGMADCSGWQVALLLTTFSAIMSTAITDVHSHNTHRGHLQIRSAEVYVVHAWHCSTSHVHCLIFYVAVSPSHTRHTAVTLRYHPPLSTSWQSCIWCCQSLHSYLSAWLNIKKVFNQSLRCTFFAEILVFSDWCFYCAD